MLEPLRPSPRLTVCLSLKFADAAPDRLATGLALLPYTARPEDLPLSVANCPAPWDHIEAERAV